MINALIIALVYWLVNLDSPLLMMCQAPLFLGGFFGFLYGDLTQGIMIGAALETIYLSAVAVGANLPNDQALAACIAIPIALQTNMSIDMAVTLAVPFGILGAFVDNFRRTVNATWWHKAQNYIDTLNWKGITFCAVWGPALVQFVVRFIPVFIISFVGADAASSVIAVLPEWLSHGLEVVGGMLPAVGFTMAISIIGGKEILPFFVIGFFVARVANLPLILMGVLAAAFAFLHMNYYKPATVSASMNDDDDE